MATGRACCRVWLILTVLLGILFTGIQAYEYGHAAFGFTDGIYSSTFYMATGFHGCARADRDDAS